MAAAIRHARQMAKEDLEATGILKAERDEKRRVNRRKVAEIRRYAINAKLPLQYHRKRWIFTARSGEKVEMGRGYFVELDGVIQQVVAV